MQAVGIIGAVNQEQPMDTYEHIITHLRLISARKQPCDDAFVKQALEHPDPIVRQ